MGIKSSSARLLAYLKREGESNLQSVCMLGRNCIGHLGSGTRNSK